MTTASPLAFGILLRRYRRAAGLTQEAVAERAGISARTISDLERGVNHAPHQDTVALLAEALALPLAERAAFMQEGARRGWRTRMDEREQEHPAASRSPLVGRQREVALLERQLAGEGPPVLLFAGEPGIGKSRLLQEAGERAVGAGWTVLAGGCHRRGGQDPYAPLLAALERYLRAQAAAQLRTDLRGCAWLVRLLPELADGPIEPLPPWTLAPVQERRLMIAAVARFLGNVAGTSGTLLVLDDLHWAGSDALDLVAALLHDPPETPLRVIAAYRDTEVEPADPLAALLARLASAGLAAQRAVRPLAPDAAAHLLAAVLVGTAGAGTEQRAQVLRRAGGVPFFLLSCAEALRRGAEGQPSAVPWDVAQSVRQRLAALPAVAREVLGVAAVVGREVPYTVLMAAIGQPEQDALAALEALHQAHLLEEAGATYRFVHDVIREVVEADLGLARRVALHRRVAETLERQTGQPHAAVLAYHYGCADAPLKAGHWLEQAGDQAAAEFANATAIADYTAARERLAAGGGATATLSRLDEKRGDVQLLISAYADAQQDFARARQAATDTVRRADLWRKEGVAWEKLGAYGQAVPAFAAAEAEGGPDGTALPALLRAEIALGRANVYGGQGQSGVQVAAAGRAVELVSGESLTPATGHIRAWAAWHQGMAAETWGDLTQMDECFGRMRDIAERIADPQASGRAWHGLAIAACLRGDLGAAEQHGHRALELLERVGEQAAIGLCWLTAGDVALERGNLTHADECMRRGLAMLEQTGQLSSLPLAWTGLGEVAWRRGDLAHAETCLRRSLAIAERLGSEWFLANAWQRLGVLAGERGDLPAATAWCRAGRRLARRYGSRITEAEASLGQAWVYLRAAATHARLRPVAALIAHARALAMTCGAAALQVEAAVLTAELQLARGLTREAQAAADDALRLARSGQRQRDEALARRLLGRCAGTKGAYTAAEAHLRAALTMLDEMGAALETARIRMALAEVLAARAAEGPIPQEAQRLLDTAVAQFIASRATLDQTHAERVAASWRERGPV